MRGLTSTLILVVVLAGLGGYIYFVDSKRPASGADGSSATKEKVFTVEADKINELRITYQGESSLLKKDESGWKMIEPAQIEADPPEAIGVATALPNVEIVRVVDEKATDLEQFGLANPQITVGFKAEGGGAGTLKLGNKNATQGEIYALKNDEKRVFLVSSFQETSFNRKPFDLRDKKILKFDRDKANSLVLAKGATSIEMSRTENEWKVVKPVPSRSDYSAIEGFLTRLSAANMSKLVEENPKDLAKYGLDKPAMTVTIGAGSAKTVLEVGKTEGDQTYAKDASRPIVFTVDTTLQGDLKKDFDDYRKKELFEFRPFYLAKLRAVLDAPGGPKTYEFEKQKPAKPSDPETWKVTRVGGPSHTADQTAMDDLLNKLVAIKAESFVDAKTKTGIDKPALVVSASFDEGKFERVRFGQVGELAYGVRDGEVSVAKIDLPSFRNALQAFDFAVTPKEPTPAPKADEKK
ncbi:MAG TPA: DUF4340 domain-containing protein [Vicinamibacterales bacterium]|nr:DUF4340 domain-containing protein [Vicinamibacterales bacterium]